MALVETSQSTTKKARESILNTPLSVEDNRGENAIPAMNNQPAAFSPLKFLKKTILFSLLIQIFFFFLALSFFSMLDPNHPIAARNVLFLVTFSGTIIGLFLIVKKVNSK